MKNIILKITSLTFALVLLLGANSCVKENYDQPPTLVIPVGELKTVADISTLALTSTVPIKITEDQSFYGVITMGEQSGNFYKQAAVRDVTGGIMLKFTSSTGLQVGDSVQVNLKGARVYNYNKLPQIDSLDITYNIKKISAGNAVTLPTLTVDDIATNAYVGQVAQVVDCQFLSSQLGSTYADAVGQTTVNRNIESCSGASIIVRTSGYANFAGELLPEGNGSMVAFVSIFGSDAQLIVRGVDEVDMAGERCGNGGGGVVTPVDYIDEAFNSAANYTDIAIEGWTNVAVQGDRKWQGKVFNTDNYVQATGYNSGLAAMETWLITPPVTNISGKVLSFKSGQAYWAHTTDVPLKVMISTDFVGDNFETATWTELTVTLATSTTANYAWVESGEVDLSAFTGNAAIAFKYFGSDTESTSIVLDDVYVGEPGGGGGGGGTVTPVDEVDEAFNSAANYTDIEIEGWTNINVQGDRKWQGKVFNTDNYVQATGYNSGLADMETWLITPPVTNISTKVLSFKSGQAYWAHTGQAPLTVLISTDFVGDNFETATWTELNPTLATSGDANYAWVESGEVNLSAFSGNGAIAFKYYGSDTESTSIIIDDVFVGVSSGGGGGGGTNTTYTEEFASSLGTYTGYSVSGTQVWEHATYDGGCAKMTGYVSGSFENEDWLISPAYDLSDNTNSVMNVRQAAGYVNGDWSQIAILISTDYTGTGDPNNATWAEVTAPNMPSGSDFTFVDSGDINISDWDGETIYVAFRYLSTTVNSSTWEISSVVVK